MERDKHITQFRFVIFGGNVLAVAMGRYSQRTYNPTVGGWERMSYMHIGQHGYCSDNLHRRKRATVEQYTPLLNELNSIGYNAVAI